MSVSLDRHSGACERHTQYDSEGERRGEIGGRTLRLVHRDVQRACQARLELVRLHQAGLGRVDELCVDAACVLGREDACKTGSVRRHHGRDEVELPVLVDTPARIVARATRLLCLV